MRIWQRKWLLQKQGTVGRNFMKFGPFARSVRPERRGGGGCLHVPAYCRFQNKGWAYAIITPALCRADRSFLLFYVQTAKVIQCELLR
jgi:hypothetical protein